LCSGAFDTVPEVVILLSFLAGDKDGSKFIDILFDEAGHRVSASFNGSIMPICGDRVLTILLLFTQTNTLLSTLKSPPSPVQPHLIYHPNSPACDFPFPYKNPSIASNNLLPTLSLFIITPHLPSSACIAILVLHPCLNLSTCIFLYSHQVATQYLLSTLSGHINPEHLLHYRQANSKLPGHPELELTPGIKFSSGRLGHMWPLVNGVALANKDKTVFCLGSDGSQQEGDDAEAARLAVAQGLNVKVVVDNNDVTIA